MHNPQNDIPRYNSPWMNHFKFQRMKTLCIADNLVSEFIVVPLPLTLPTTYIPHRAESRQIERICYVPLHPTPSRALYQKMLQPTRLSRKYSVQTVPVIRSYDTACIASTQLPSHQVLRAATPAVTLKHRFQRQEDNHSAVSNGYVRGYTLSKTSDIIRTNVEQPVRSVNVSKDSSTLNADETYTTVFTGRDSRSNTSHRYLELHSRSNSHYNGPSSNQPRRHAALQTEAARIERNTSENPRKRRRRNSNEFSNHSNKQYKNDVRFPEPSLSSTSDYEEISTGINIPMDEGKDSTESVQQPLQELNSLEGDEPQHENIWLFDHPSGGARNKTPYHTAMGGPPALFEEMLFPKLLCLTIALCLSFVLLWLVGKTMRRANINLFRNSYLSVDDEFEFNSKVQNVLSMPSKF